jgi:hypothetical protein
MASQDTTPKWDDLFQVKGKVVLVTGGSRGELQAAMVLSERQDMTDRLRAGIGKMVSQSLCAASRFLPLTYY